MLISVMLSIWSTHYLQQLPTRLEFLSFVLIKVCWFNTGKYICWAELFHSFWILTAAIFYSFEIGCDRVSVIESQKRQFRSGVNEWGRLFFARGYVCRPNDKLMLSRKISCEENLSSCVSHSPDSYPRVIHNFTPLSLLLQERKCWEWFALCIAPQQQTSCDVVSWSKRRDAAWKISLMFWQAFSRRIAVWLF